MIPGMVRVDRLHGVLSGASASGLEGRRLRLIAIAVGLGWSVLFVVIGVGNELQAYGDGSIFSYSVAVQDAWAFHWHNISGRVFVYLACFVPAEAYVRLTGDAAGGVVLYGFLFYVAPLVGLAATYLFDRSKGRVLFGYACVSTACLCPLVFGFPTEMWMAHAVLWPALALAHYARRGVAGTFAVFAALLALAFTHAGGMVFALGVVVSTALRGLRHPALKRAVGAMLIVTAIWLCVKAELQPDNYFGSMLPRAGWNFFDLRILLCPMSLLLAGAVAGYGLSYLVLSRVSPSRAQLGAAAVTVIALAVYWLWFDHALHAENRYYLRTELFLLAPVFAAAAVIQVLLAEGWLGFLEPVLARFAPSRSGLEQHRFDWNRNGAAYALHPSPPGEGGRDPGFEPGERPGGEKPCRIAMSSPPGLARLSPPLDHPPLAGRDKRVRGSVWKTDEHALVAQMLSGAILVAMLVHAVETGKFVVAWDGYKSAIVRLASGGASDPALGDPRFVSSDRLPGRFRPLAWASTTQYLSVLLAPGFSPNHLVVNPDEGYYWLSCETATASRLAQSAVPTRSRDMIGTDACLHRKRLIAQAPGGR